MAMGSVFQVWMVHNFKLIPTRYGIYIIYVTTILIILL